MWKILLKYGSNILLGIDQFGNVLLGGDPDESISSRLGKLKRRHGGVIPWYRPFSGFTDFLLNKIQKDHSTKAIENDEGKDAILH